MDLKSTPLMLPFEDCLGVHKCQPSLLRPVLPLPTYPPLFSSSHSSCYPDISLRLPDPKPPSQKLTVDAQLAMPHHLLDLSLLLQIIQRFPCKAAIDLQSVHERGDCDEAVGLNVLVEFVGGGFVEDDGVVGLVLDY